MTRRSRYTTASELAAYVYCRRAWWLRHVRRFEPENRRALTGGEAAHSRHGLTVSLAGWLSTLGRIVLFLGILFVVALLLLG